MFPVGAVYDITPDLSVYGQYTTAQDPIGSPIFTVNATQNFNLSSSRQGEIRAKATFQDGQGRRDTGALPDQSLEILTDTAPPSAANNVSNIGSQYSNGVEFQELDSSCPQWKVGLNAPTSMPRYGYFYDRAPACSPTAIDRSSDLRRTCSRNIASSPTCRSIWVST